MPVSSAVTFVYAFTMQPKTPFIFSMPPLLAWPLAVTTSIALLIAAALMFAGSGEPRETEVDGTDGTPEVTQQVSATEQAIYLGLLIVPVGLIPVVARRKRMNTLRWSIAGVGVGFVQLMTQLIFLHPLMVLIAIVYLRSQPPAAPATSLNAPDAPVPAAQGAVSDAVEFVDAPPKEEPPPPPVRRRPTRRRRRPRL